MAQEHGPPERVVRKRVVKKAASAAPTTRPPHKTVAVAKARTPDAIKSTRSSRRLPPSALIALCGLASGLVAVGLTTLGMMLFDLTRGTPNGGPWGFLAFVVMVCVVILFGAALLSAASIAHPRVTSVLATVLVLIVILAFLMGIVFSVWMWLVVPALGAAMFAASHWLISRTEA